MPAKKDAEGAPAHDPDDLKPLPSFKLEAVK
jgi:hypothetical protein